MLHVIVAHEKIDVKHNRPSMVYVTETGNIVLESSLDSASKFDAEHADESIFFLEKARTSFKTHTFVLVEVSEDLLVKPIMRLYSKFLSPSELGQFQGV